MIEKSSNLIWGVVAFAIYLFMVGVLVFYFNTHDEKKPKHYVKKDEHRIQVALSAPKSTPQKKVTKPKIIKPKQKPKVKPKPKMKPKKTVKKKIVKKKIVKSKVIKEPKKKTVKKKKVIKQQDVNLTKVKKKKALDLFSDIEVKQKKPAIKSTKEPLKKIVKNIVKTRTTSVSASKRINNSRKKQKNMDSGVENAYIAKVEAILGNWPAQSEFAGEKANVTFFIKPTGKFKFNVTSGSNNTTFNSELTRFLRQLQGIGFGSHNAGRTYEFVAEFIAKE